MRLFSAELHERTPIVILANGTGVKVSCYAAVLRHLASWGFVAIGTEDEYSFSGFSAEMCVRYLSRLHMEPVLMDGTGNPFYGKIDLDNIGICCHSQGGVAVINAITQMPHAGIYRCTFVLSHANKQLAHDLLWDYVPSCVQIPIAPFSGTGPMDAQVIISKEQLEEIYIDITQAPFKLMARRRDTDHGQMLYAADE